MNTGLPPDQQDDFLAYLGLVTEPPANYTIRAYLDMLESHGPLWITTGDGISYAHARVLVAVAGDGSYEKTYFKLIDPASGKYIVQDALQFSLEFEREARVVVAKGLPEFRIQILHW
jgi:hypothetical protein